MAVCGLRRKLAEAFDEEFRFRERVGKLPSFRVICVGLVVLLSELAHFFDCADFHSGVCFEIVAHDFFHLFLERKRFALAGFGCLCVCEGGNEKLAKSIGLAHDFGRFVFGEFKSNVSHERNISELSQMSTNLLI